MVDWHQVKLGELCGGTPGAIAIGPFGSRMKSECYVDDGVPVIRGTNISTNRAWKGDWVFVSESFADEMPKCNAKEGDLVFPHRGSIGEVAIVPGDRPRYMLSTSLMKFTADRQKVNPLFLFYYFRSPEGRNEILTFSSQVGTPGIGQPLTSLKQFRVPLPPLKDQQAIAELLGALDDQIDLNRRMNQALEAMARAVFKDWFVDHGPVQGKVEGSSAYVASDIWSLFPNRFDDEGRPEGWRSVGLGEIATLAGQSVRPHELSPDTPYIGLEHMPRRSIALDSWEGAGKVTSGKLAFRRGDFLFGKLRPYFHKVGIAPLDGICSTDIVVLKARRATMSAFVISCISQDEFVAYTDQTSGGTKMPRTSWDLMARYELTLPSDQLMAAFEGVVSPLFERIVRNVHESRALAQVRGLLLPKLVSGEIRLRAAEKLMEKAS